MKPPPPGFELDAAPQKVTAAPPAGFTLDAPEDSRGFFGRAVDFVTGNTPSEYDFPDLPGRVIRPDGNVVDFSRIGLTRNNPLYEAQVIEAQMPGARVRFDADGNTIVDMEMVDADVSRVAPMPLAGLDVPVGEANVAEAIQGMPVVNRSFYVNRPGLSPADARQGTLEAMMSGAGGAGGAGIARSLIGRAAGGFVGAGAGSFAQDAAARGAGSEQPLDPREAALAGGLAIAGEVGSALVSRLLRSVLGAPSAIRNGKVTPQAVARLEAAGIAPEEITPDLVEAFSRRAGESFANGGPLDDAARAAVAQAESLPEPVRLSRGQATGISEQQAFERAAASGARGEKARNIAQPFFDTQEAALRRNAEIIEETLGGGGRIEPHQGAGRIAGEVAERAQAQYKEVNNAYKHAREVARDTRATIGGEHIKGIRRAIGARLADPSVGIILDRQMPKAIGHMKDLGKIIKGGDSARVKLVALERWRQNVRQSTDDLMSRVSPGQKAPPEVVALMEMRKTYDKYIEGAVDQALISGDDNALAAFKNARTLRYRYGQMYQSSKVIERMTEGDLTPEQASNLIFGASQLGTGKSVTEAVDTVRKLRTLLGPESEGYNLLRQEAFLRLLKGQPDKGWSAAKFRTSFDRAMRDAPTLMREMFSTEEIGRMRALRSVGARTQLGKFSGDVSGREVARFVIDVMGNSRLGRFMLNRVDAAGQFSETAAAGAARDAFSQIRSTRPLIPPGAGAAVGGASAGAFSGGAEAPAQSPLSTEPRQNMPL